MLTRDLLLTIPQDGLQRLADALLVGRDFIFQGGSKYPFDFLDSQSNTIVVEETKGDFNLSAQVFLFTTDDAGLDGQLLNLSNNGLAIAMPDEESERPFDYIVFHNGEKITCEIDEDEVFEENFVIHPKSLRRKLRDIQGKGIS